MKQPHAGRAKHTRRGTLTPARARAHGRFTANLAAAVVELSPCRAIPGAVSQNSVQPPARLTGT